MTSIAVIIVNWNGQQLLAKCLSEIFKQEPKNFIIYFIDNGSTDNSVNFVRLNFPKIKTIVLNKNFGTVIGRNIGIQTALKNPEIKYIITLDSDAYPYPNCFKNLIEKAESDSKIGIVNSKILHCNPPIIQNTGMAATKNLLFIQNNEDKSADSCNEPFDILAPCTASALIKREVVEQIGLFDPNYFMYQDDIDFGLRSWLHNWKVVYEPKSVSFHYGSQSSKKVPNLITFYVTRNALLLGIKFYPWFILIKKIYNLKEVRAQVIAKNDYSLFLSIKCALSALIKTPTTLIKRKLLYYKTQKKPSDMYNIIKQFEINQ